MAEDDTQTPKDGSVPVRPRASSRKRRSEGVEHEARRPVQERSQARFELIISTLEEVLEVSSIEDISVYDIAERAKVSPASINYFFPTMTALRVELIRRYLADAADHHQTYRDQHRGQLAPDWQLSLRQSLLSYRDLLHSRRPMAEILLGAMPNAEVRRVFAVENDLLAERNCEALMEDYVMPEIPGLKEAMSHSFDCIDALWARSYAFHGHINDATVEASSEIQLSYLRMYLPAHLAPRRDGERAPTGDEAPIA